MRLTVSSVALLLGLLVSVISATATTQAYEYQSRGRSGLRAQRHLSSKSNTSADSTRSKSTKSPTMSDAAKGSKSNKSVSKNGGKKASQHCNDMDASAIDKIHAADDTAITDDEPISNTTILEESKASDSTNTADGCGDTAAKGNTTEIAMLPTLAPTDGTASPTTSAPTTSPTKASATLRTIHLLHPNSTNECLAYDETAPQATVRMIECTTSDDTKSTQLDHWEIMDQTTGLFFLRHKQSQLCIPMNPEFPDQPFDCFRYSGSTEAVADSLNGLVDCGSGFAATMGVENGALYLYNKDCLVEIDPGHETDIILMSYRRGHAENGTQIALWGERMLMDMLHLVEMHNFRANWTFVDV